MPKHKQTMIGVIYVECRFNIGTTSTAIRELYHIDKNKKAKMDISNGKPQSHLTKSALSE